MYRSRNESRPGLGWRPEVVSLPEADEEKDQRSEAVAKGAEAGHLGEQEVQGEDQVQDDDDDDDDGDDDSWESLYRRNSYNSIYLDNLTVINVDVIITIVVESAIA